MSRFCCCLFSNQKNDFYQSTSRKAENRRASSRASTFFNKLRRNSENIENDIKIRNDSQSLLNETVFPIYKKVRVITEEANENEIDTTNNLSNLDKIETVKIANNINDNNNSDKNKMNKNNDLNGQEVEVLSLKKSSDTQL